MESTRTRSQCRVLGDERGFTLVELLVVALTIAILIAISIPLIQGFRIRAQDRAVQSQLRSALILERNHWVETGAFTADVSQLQVYDPQFRDGDPVAAPYHPVLWVQGPENQRVCLFAQSDSGRWFVILEDADPAGAVGVTNKTYFGQGLPGACTDALAAGYSESIEAGW